jgi:predicted kinase
MNTGYEIGKKPLYDLQRVITELNWDQLGQYNWALAMQDCPQSPIFHAEGDVWTHTRMVVEALLNLQEYHALPQPEQALLLHAALLHDVAKPICTVWEDGDIRSPRHAKVGEKVAREILWDAPFDFREQVCALVRLHGLPLWGLEKTDPVRTAILASWRIPNVLTYLLAKADVLGRICPTQDELLYRLELYRELCLENDCFYTERPWHTTHSRFRYFWSEDTYPVEVFDDTGFEVVILSGVAGSGKDTFCQKHYANWPVVSLDQIRQELKIKPDDRDGQGKVAHLAYERAKAFCRKKTAFVWNSTNLTTEMRSKIIGTLRVYNPRFSIMYLETAPEGIFERRKADIKSSVLERMIRQLEVPLQGEAHHVAYVTT